MDIKVVSGETRSLIVDLTKNDFVTPITDVGEGPARAIIRYEKHIKYILSVQILVINGWNRHPVNDATFSLDEANNSIIIWKSLRFDNYRIAIIGI